MEGHGCASADPPAPYCVNTTARAAYVFSATGACLLQLPPLLAALSSLHATRPAFPSLVMLAPDCWAPLRAALSAARALPLLVPRLSASSCAGAFSRPAHFNTTFTILRVFALAPLEAALLLDSDLSVRRPLDHLLRLMLDNPRLFQLRTPQQCRMLRGADDFSPSRRRYAEEMWNTGVWAVRPDARVHAQLAAFLAAGNFSCGVGVQSAATAMFNSAGYSPPPLRLAAGRAPVVLHLHAGYNLKADVGGARCLAWRGLAPSDVHVVHWSGTRKPWLLRHAAQIGRMDAVERPAALAYMRDYCAALVTHVPPPWHAAPCVHALREYQRQASSHAGSPAIQLLMGQLGA
ncbi:hypothetical protein AB1Y20_013640 [Prymnesium parvum]|uniref:Hexosyltransferase n=1 Tax=Prymnesium parvum TaxID=97485 RepID=A0AB34IG60_PRYPA